MDLPPNSLPKNVDCLRFLRGCCCCCCCEARGRTCSSSSMIPSGEDRQSHVLLSASSCCSCWSVLLCPSLQSCHLGHISIAHQPLSCSESAQKLLFEQQHTVSAGLCLVLVCMASPGFHYWPLVFEDLSISLAHPTRS